MLKAHRRFPRVKEKLPRQPDKQHGRATTKGYSYYSIARNEKKGAYTMSEQSICEAIRTYKEYQRMMEELEAEIETVKDQIKSAMAEKGVDEITAGEYKVRWKAVKSYRFDTTAFRNAMPELAGKFTKMIESKRFSVV